jgi:predicted alpha/beta superfamily hydrolase
MEYLGRKRTVVVGIGYPNVKAVYDYRRGPDLTPASRDGKYEMPLDKDGKPRTDISFGKAKEFLDFIRNDVMEHVLGKLLPIPQLKQGRKALFGHSYGAIFALHALYTAPSMFDTFIAASPIIWWNKSFLTSVEEPEFIACPDENSSPPSLLLTCGGSQEDVVKRPEESEEIYKWRCAAAEDPRMKEAIIALSSRLKDCPRLRVILTHEFREEDHGSAAVTGLQRGIMEFLRGVI